MFRKVEAAVRSPNLKYAVGMVMRHLTLNYKCVIYDWDPVCLASAEWQGQMNVAKLALKDEQPFYNVLVEDGSHRYVAQGWNVEMSLDFYLCYRFLFSRKFRAKCGYSFLASAGRHRQALFARFRNALCAKCGEREGISR